MPAWRLACAFSKWRLKVSTQPSSSAWEGCFGQLPGRGVWEPRGRAGDPLALASHAVPLAQLSSTPAPFPGPRGLQQHAPDPSTPALSPSQRLPIVTLGILTVASGPSCPPPASPALCLHCLLSAHSASSLLGPGQCCCAHPTPRRLFSQAPRPSSRPGPPEWQT